MKRLRLFNIRSEEDPKRVIAWAVAQRVRTEGERRRLRQEDLAERADIKRPDIARLEKGRHMPSVATLQKIARALNLDMGDLIAMPTPPSAEDMLELTKMAVEGLGEWDKQLQREDTN